MKYDLKGSFLEVCDCEVICSCWAEVAPAMGQCTGIYVWTFEDGSTVTTQNGAVFVKDHKVAVINHGSSCDDAEHLLLVIDAPPKDSCAALFEAFKASSGPWNQVFDFPPDPGEVVVRPGNIEINQTGKKYSIKITANFLDGPMEAWSALEVIANTDFSPSLKLDAEEAEPRDPPPGVTNKNPLAKRVVGDLPAVINIGSASAESGDKYGLSILAEGGPIAKDPDKPAPYRFDIDVTMVSAMRGQFHYELP